MRVNWDWQLSEVEDLEIKWEEVWQKLDEMGNPIRFYWKHWFNCKSKSHPLNFCDSLPKRASRKVGMILLKAWESYTEPSCASVWMPPTVWILSYLGEILLFLLTEVELCNVLTKKQNQLANQCYFTNTRECEHNW